MVQKFNLDEIALPEKDEPEETYLSELQKLVNLQLEILESMKKERKAIEGDYYAEASMKRTLDFIDSRIAKMRSKLDANDVLVEEASPEKTEKEKEFENEQTPEKS